MRALRWVGVVIVVAGAVWFGGQWALTAWITHGKAYDAHSMHEAHIIVDEIKAHDSSINATCTTDDDALPDVVIRDVFDRDKQDQILAWAKVAKSSGRVHRRITVDFQKEIPHSDVPDEILRSETF